MLKIGDIIEVTIEKIVFGGEGLAYFNQMVVFVPQSCLNDVLKVKIISTKKTYVRALIEEILTPSKDRNNNLVSFEQNSGCDFNHIKYEKQLEYKNSMLIDMFSSISKIDVSKIYKGIIPAEDIFNYRNKIATPFFKKNGIIKTGFFKRKSHDIFYVEEDLLKSNIASEIEKDLLKKLNTEKFTVYNDNTNEGFLKTLIIRNNFKNEVMICIVVNKESQINKLKKILKKLYDENKSIVSVYISIKKKQNNIILGEKNILVAGEKSITESLFSINFNIYVDSFFQINIQQVKKLYSLALEYIGEYKNSNIIDAFSGTGTIAMILSKNSNMVYGIESVKSAVDSARQTASDNNITNVKFICDKVENSIDNILNNTKIDYIVFDPPRKGLEKNIIEEVANKNIEKIVYISCEPSKFARDLNIFKSFGYDLIKLGAVDMFPNTHHIECVGLLEKRK